MRAFRGIAITAAAAAVLGCIPVTVVVQPPRTPAPDRAPPVTSEPTAVPSAPAPAVSPAPATPRPGVAPSPRASLTPRPIAFPSGQGPASTTPSAQPSLGSAPKIVIIGGRVFDEAGGLVDDAQVTVRSLDASVPYTAVATTAGGHWVVNNVPEGANVEIMATKDGWTSRRRVGSWRAGAGRNLVDFGSDGQLGEDKVGGPFFISDWPEIQAVDPAWRAVDVDGAKLRLRLTLSEPFAPRDRALVERAVRVYAADAYDAELDEDGEWPLAVDLDARVPDALRVGAGPNGPVLEAAWDAEGRVLTLTSATPLPPDSEWQVALVALAAGRFGDPEGHRLGTGERGQPELEGNDAVPAGRLLLGTFRHPELALRPSDDLQGVAWRWQATHLNASGFTTRR